MMRISALCCFVRLLLSISIICHSTNQIESFSTSSTTSAASPPQPEVSVWDNVLSSNTRNNLHRAASKDGLGHKSFSRPNNNNHNNILEQTIDDILTQIGDDSKYVEYWTRQEWRSIEAHADVDEFLAKAQDTNAAAAGSSGGTTTPPSFRYPTNGHVLYLQVGSHVQGPTCVFRNRHSGGDLLRSSPTTAETTPSPPPPPVVEPLPVEVITVPAVPGRLLRFQGDYLHAVPRPTDVWFLPFVQGAPAYTPEEEWGRSVVLFNTWGEEPPLGMPLDDGTIPEAVGRGVDDGTDDNDDDDDGDDDGANDLGIRHNRSDWLEAYTLLANAQDAETSYQQMSLDNEEEEGDDNGLRLPAKIWLLGNERRRDHPMRTLKLAARESLRMALFEETMVSRHLLDQIG